MIASNTPVLGVAIASSLANSFNAGGDNVLDRMQVFVNDVIPTPSVAFADLVFDATNFGGPQNLTEIWNFDPQADGSNDLYGDTALLVTAGPLASGPVTIYGYVVYNHGNTEVAVIVRFTTPQVMSIPGQVVTFIPRCNVVAGPIVAAESV